MNKLISKNFLITAFLFLLMFTSTNSNALDWFSNKYKKVPITIFDLKNYDQNIDYWVNPNQPEYNKLLVDKNYQQQRLIDFYQHLYGYEKLAKDSKPLTKMSSPWSKSDVEAKLMEEPTPYQEMVESLEEMDNSYPGDEEKNPKNIVYGSNFKPYRSEVIANIKAQIPLEFLKSVKFEAKNYAITTRNTQMRLLPTNEPIFYDMSKAEEGYPFDILQVSSLWVGSPIYIIARSNDKSWSYIISDSHKGWVPSEDIAEVSINFLQKWKRLSKSKMIAITKNQASLYNKQAFVSALYIGTTLPLIHQNDQEFAVLYPLRNEQGKAVIKQGRINSNQATKMPLALSKGNIALIIKELTNRPYGWGGLYFYNDCSQELKSLFTPFGFWLNRHSSKQVEAGKMEDKSKLDSKARFNYLSQNGHPFLTIVYIGGHVFLYLGNYHDEKKPDLSIILTYQNIWGLSPADRSYRAVIGQSLLFPLKKIDPENKEVKPLTDKSYFQLIYLDQWPSEK